MYVVVQTRDGAKNGVLGSMPGCVHAMFGSYYCRVRVYQVNRYHGGTVVNRDQILLVKKKREIYRVSYVP